jgi:hypothetical protein
MAIPHIILYPDAGLAGAGHWHVLHQFIGWAAGMIWLLPLLFSKATGNSSLTSISTIKWVGRVRNWGRVYTHGSKISAPSALEQTTE